VNTEKYPRDITLVSSVHSYWQKNYHMWPTWNSDILCLKNSWQIEVPETWQDWSSKPCCNDYRRVAKTQPGLTQHTWPDWGCRNRREFIFEHLLISINSMWQRWIWTVIFLTPSAKKHCLAGTLMSTWVMLVHWELLLTAEWPNNSLLAATKAAPVTHVLTTKILMTNSVIDC